MIMLLLGVLAAGGIWWAIKTYGKDEAKIALVKQGGGALALGFALILLLKGRFDMAMGLAGLGMYLLSGSVSGLFQSHFNGRPAAGSETHQADGYAGSSEHRPGSGMTEDEAYQILGLQPGASADAITSAHRTLMKKFHPDQGGTTYLATRVNQARDILLQIQR